MNGTDDPATESQLIHLRQLGYVPDRELTRIQAAQLIGSLHRRNVQGAHPPIPPSSASHETDAYSLWLAVDEARRALSTPADRTEEAKQALAGARRNRQDFWLETCRDPSQRQTRAGSHARQIWDLYMKYGCRFNVPTHEQAQEVLDALDAALPGWDRDHAELYFQTLELNFPELLLQRGRVGNSAA